MHFVPLRSLLYLCCTIIMPILWVYALESAYPNCDLMQMYGRSEIDVCVLQDTEVTLNTTLQFRNPRFTTLECRRCRLHHIPVGMFSNPRLKRVLLPHSGLERLTSKDFIGAGALVELNISHNALTAIDAHQFMMTESLSVLDLSHNRIEHIDEKAFADQTKLTYLNLADNRLHALTATIPTTLLQLDLQNNSIGGKFELLVHLEQLDVSHNRIENLTIASPDNTTANATGHHITKLNVSHNNITSLQPLRSLSTLRHLDVSFNNIASLPLDTFARMRHLETLNLCDSGLQPDSIQHGLFVGPASSLKSLDISNNRLRTLDWSTLTVLGNLQTLHVDGNALTDLGGLSFGGSFAQRLTLIGIADNLFNCTYLASVAEQLGAGRLFVPDSVAVFDTTNVHGMACMRVSKDATRGSAGGSTGDTTNVQDMACVKVSNDSAGGSTGGFTGGTANNTVVILLGSVVLLMVLVLVTLGHLVLVIQKRQAGWRGVHNLRRVNSIVTADIGLSLIEGASPQIHS